jgi:hypothetical protein
MQMMGVLMIDNVGARLDGLVEVAHDFYYRRMTVASDFAKSTLVEREAKQETRVDPLLGSSLFNLADNQLPTRQGINRHSRTKL